MGAGAGIGWLYPLVDGAPAVGWELAARYLVLPALLVGVSQTAVHGLRPQGGCMRGHWVAVPAGRRRASGGLGTGGALPGAAGAAGGSEPDCCARTQASGWVQARALGGCTRW